MSKFRLSVLSFAALMAATSAQAVIVFNNSSQASGGTCQ